MPDPETDELRIDQLRREREERDRAQAAEEPGETQQHERRAERAAYLEDKLRERGDAEDEADREDR